MTSKLNRLLANTARFNNHKRRLAREAADDSHRHLPVNTGKGTCAIDGSPVVGQMLTAIFNDDDPDGPASNIRFQWLHAGRFILGAIESTHVIGENSLGKAVSLRVRYYDGKGFTETIYSADTAAVAAA